MEKSYTLKTAFPNAKCSEALENAIVSKINADVKKRIISAEVIFDTIVKRADIEKFRKEVIRIILLMTWCLRRFLIHRILQFRMQPDIALKFLQRKIHCGVQCLIRVLQRMRASVLKLCSATETVNFSKTII